MAKTKISEYSATANSNTDVASINIDEGCAPSGINNAIRAVMGHLKDFQSGTSNDPFTIGSSGSLTLSYGTAGGVAYLSNPGKVLTTGSALTFDGTNIALGTVGAKVNFATTGSATQNYVGVASDGYSLELATLRGASQPIAYKLNYGGNHIWSIAGSDKMTLDSTGLGIGTSSPSQKLDVNGQATVAQGGAYGWRITNSGGIRSASNGVLQVSADTGNAYANSAITFDIDGSTLATLDSSGNLGLGVTPAAKFNIGSGGAARFNRSDNATYGEVSYGGAGVGMKYYDANSDGHRFFNGATQAMTLDASGNLLVGKTGISKTTVGFEGRPDGTVVATSSLSTNAGGDTWDTYSTGAGAYRFYVGWGGTIYATNTTITAISSDERLKQNIVDYDKGLAQVLALRPRSFEYKSEPGRVLSGFISQEVQTVIPEAIEPTKEDPDMFTYSIDWYPLLVKAIQEQNQLIQSLTDRISALEGAKA